MSYSHLPIDTLLTEREILKSQITSMGYKDKWTIKDHQTMSELRTKHRAICVEIDRQSKLREDLKNEND